jgi:drug/metabolite transporter (DMT)-like permease
MIEVSFLLMYRYGWRLSTANLVTGAAINVVLVGLGVALLGERVSVIKAIGIVCCMVGVALIGWRGQ